MTAIAPHWSGTAHWLARWRNASPLLWRMSLAFLGAFVLCLLLAAIDQRLINGISVWVKPAKFFLSLAVHMLTLSAAMLLLPGELRRSRTVGAMASIMAAMAVFEMAYITFRAARAEASHFNNGSELAALLYTMMGAGAVAMMLITILLGVLVLRRGRPGPLALATGMGLILAGILTIMVGSTLGGMESHWIGGDRSDASGLPLLGWSTTGGDLRSAHFAALHMAQAMPLAGYVGGRTLVWIAAGLGIVATIALFALALMERPLVAL